jgi:hypothetical protein
MALGASSAQPIKKGWIVGGTSALELGTAYSAPKQGLTAGATFEAELNAFVAFGLELNYVAKGGRALDLDQWTRGTQSAEMRLEHMEMPISVRLSNAHLLDITNPFVRLALAPSWLFRCSGRYAVPPNTPETWEIIGRLGDLDALPREPACDADRENIDLTWQAGVGTSFRLDRREFGVELRVSNGLRNVSARHRDPIKSRALSLLFSTATRGF